MSTPASRQPVENVSVHEEELDQEWIELLVIARNLGITPEEIRNFLQQYE